MTIRYDRLRAAIAGCPLPAMLVDLDAFDANVARIDAALAGHNVTMRLASKSLRVPALIQRVLTTSGCARGVMCFSVREALYLSSLGIDDLLVAYPTSQAADLRAAASASAAGKQIHLVVDSAETLDALTRAAASVAGSSLSVLLDVDMSVHLNQRLHLGVRRSPLREPQRVVALAEQIATTRGLRFAGLLAYEAQIAGLQDNNPFDRLGNSAKTAIRRASIPLVARQRRAIVQALERAHLAPTIVNGGGTGSLDSTCREPVVTEVTAGSAFFKPHLFDYYKRGVVTRLAPACFFALEVCRRPADNMVTCLGGGYVASGPPGRDKIPLPWLPAGLKLLDMEMAGEVQTPLIVPTGVELQVGDPVFFRHAKAGELSERFSEVLLQAGGALIDRVATYRGAGHCFL